MKSSPSKFCPCGTGLPFEECCSPYLSGEHFPLTAESLMRSRYTAYQEGDAPYLLDTWHPDTRPPTLSLESDVRWIGLKILNSSQGQADDEFGTVHFQARYKVNGKAGRLEENSRFQKIDGRWLYVDGEIVEKSKKSKRSGS